MGTLSLGNSKSKVVNVSNYQQFGLIEFDWAKIEIPMKTLIV